MKDNGFYIGFTTNIKQRVHYHNEGNVNSTKKRRPLILEMYIVLKNKQKALALEKYFKSGSGNAVLRKRMM